MSHKAYFIYIMASDTAVLYVGVTNNLKIRSQQHRQGTIDGFTKKYRCHRLVYFEETSDVFSAIRREKQLKGWSRYKKMELIRQTNPTWRDLIEPDPSTSSG